MNTLLADELNQETATSTAVQHMFLDVDGGQVECKRHVAKQPRSGAPILFLHGIFVGAWCWQNFLNDFAAHGFDAWAISFRGHGDSSRGAAFGLDDFLADAQAAVDEIERVTGQKPVVVGHSMGGLVLQRLMLKRSLAGAVLLCSMPPQGLLPLAWNNWCVRPLEMVQLGQLMLECKPVNAAQLQFGMFAQDIDGALLEQYALQTVSESPRLWQDLLQGAMLSPWLRSCPVVVVGASEDTLVPAAMTQMTALSYGVHVRWLQGFGHGVMLEHDWRQASARVRGIIHKMML